MKLPRFSVVEWLFGAGPSAGRGRLWPRWLFLRGLGLIFLSAFYSLIFQIRGLIGPEGILPADAYLQDVARQLGARASWYAPTVFWLGSSDRALMLVTALGLIASVTLIFNLWPRGSIAICLVSYLSFVSAAQDFSMYQSDGMLLAAGFVSLFFAPPGLGPRLGEDHPPSRASHFLLQWEWLRIYFESGVVKLASGDVQWRSLTALDTYYSNGPLPNWIGWYVQQMPHMFHAVTAFVTLFTEIAIPWMMFLPRRYRILCFFIVTPFQIGIILTANLAFINHLSLLMGVLLLDDQFLQSACERMKGAAGNWKMEIGKWKIAKFIFGRLKAELMEREAALRVFESGAEIGNRQLKIGNESLSLAQKVVRQISLLASAVMQTWVFYVSTFYLLNMSTMALPLPTAPVIVLQPFRIANGYGLFAVMTRNRYEIEFQGSNDGVNWKAYVFRYKPQDPAEAPRWYAPYQPRFDWNLWFASLAPWRQSPMLIGTEQALLTNSRDVLALFKGNPFPDSPPRYVRAVMWQYWFTDLAMKHKTGMWWSREMLGLFAPELSLLPDGRVGVVVWPAESLPPRESPYEP